MPKVNLSHFEASLLFAVVTSVVLGIVKSDPFRMRRGKENASAASE